MRAHEFIMGHVIYNLAYTYKFQLKTSYILQTVSISAVLDPKFNPDMCESIVTAVTYLKRCFKNVLDHQ